MNCINHLIRKTIEKKLQTLKLCEFFLNNKIYHSYVVMNTYIGILYWWNYSWSIIYKIFLMVYMTLRCCNAPKNYSYILKLGVFDLKCVILKLFKSSLFFANGKKISSNKMLIDFVTPDSSIILKKHLKLIVFNKKWVTFEI